MQKVLAVSIIEKKGQAKHLIEKGYFEVNHGLVGDIHAGNWHRQVSLLGQESIDKMTALGIIGFCTSKFAENITTEGIELFTLTIGTRLKIGETIMEITQIGKECYSGCQIITQVRDCIMPRECIFTKVIEAGWIKPGDEIEII